MEKLLMKQLGAMFHARLILSGMSFIIKAKHGIWHRLNVKRKPAEKHVYKTGKHTQSGTSCE